MIKLWLSDSEYYSAVLNLLQDEKMEKLEERGEIELFKEKSQLSTYYCPSEVLKSPNEAMEFLSRTWSPSSSDFSQILWSNVSSKRS